MGVAEHGVALQAEAVYVGGGLLERPRLGARAALGAALLALVDEQ